MVTTRSTETQMEVSEEQEMIKALSEQLQNYYDLRDPGISPPEDLHFTCRIERQDHHLSVPSQ